MPTAAFQARESSAPEETLPLQPRATPSTVVDGDLDISRHSSRDDVANQAKSLHLANTDASGDHTVETQGSHQSVTALAMKHHLSAAVSDPIPFSWIYID